MIKIFKYGEIFQAWLHSSDDLPGQSALCFATGKTPHDLVSNARIFLQSQADRCNALCGLSAELLEKEVRVEK